jgi:hypothetical protein
LRFRLLRDLICELSLDLADSAVFPSAALVEGRASCGVCDRDRVQRHPTPIVWPVVVAPICDVARIIARPPACLSVFGLKMALPQA